MAKLTVEIQYAYFEHSVRAVEAVSRTTGKGATEAEARADLAVNLKRRAERMPDLIQELRNAPRCFDTMEIELEKSDG